MRVEVTRISQFRRKHDLASFVHGYEVGCDLERIRHAGGDSRVRCLVVGCCVGFVRTVR